MFRLDLELKWDVKRCKWEQWTQLWFYTLDCVACSERYENFASFLFHNFRLHRAAEWCQFVFFFGLTLYEIVWKTIKLSDEVKEREKREENLIDELAAHTTHITHTKTCNFQLFVFTQHIQMHVIPSKVSNVNLFEVQLFRWNYSHSFSVSRKYFMMNVCSIRCTRHSQIICTALLPNEKVCKSRALNSTNSIQCLLWTGEIIFWITFDDVMNDDNWKKNSDVLVNRSDSVQFCYFALSSKWIFIEDSSTSLLCQTKSYNQFKCALDRRNLMLLQQKILFQLPDG